LLSEEFYEKFLNKKAFSFNTFENNDSYEDDYLNELEINSSELKIMEMFYLKLYENLKVLCIQQKDSNIKINVNKLIYQF
jgi:hypothetical protein